MKIPKEEIIAILAPFNPWWRGEKILDLPTWRRSVFHELMEWLKHPPVHRAVLISGPRQVGKTTLLLQSIEELINGGVPRANILYVTFDHPVFKLAGVDAVLEAWRELEPKVEGDEYLFLDEAQFIKNFGTWSKHQTDFNKSRKIVYTGSAMPLIHSGEESGVGRSHTLSLSTLSFYEYLQIKNIALPKLPTVESLFELFDYSVSQLYELTQAVQFLVGHFHQYLVQGGFPQIAVLESLARAQQLIREDIIDKVLKRDMTALFGVRRILELEQTFIYLCMHDGGIQDLQTLSSNLGITKQTVQNFIHLLEASHLVYRLPPFGYGKEILRARYKLYLADPGIAPAILMKGKTIIENPKALGHAVETAVFAHLKAHGAMNNAHFSYWKDSRNKELDLIIELSGDLFPFEIKYQSQVTSKEEVEGLLSFCKQKEAIKFGFIVTKSTQDVGILETKNLSAKVMRIPAPILCYWLGQSEATQKRILK